MATRQKQVFPRDMVAHIWANGGQDSAREPSGNFFFTGRAIYSYGSHFMIAYRDDSGRVLWNDSSYSNTTGKHQWAVRGAIRQSSLESMVYVPGLTYDDVRQFERAREGKTGAVVKMVEKLAARVISEIQSIGSMRSMDKMRAVLESCRRDQSAGQWLCAEVSKGRKKARWPLPALPDEMPADKAGRLALVRVYAKGKALEDYAKLMRNITVSIPDFADDVKFHSDDHFSINNWQGRYDGLGRSLVSAAKLYELAHGKPSAAVNKAFKALRAIEGPMHAKIGAHAKAHAVAEIRTQMRDAFKAYNDRNAYSLTRVVGYPVGRIAKALTGYSDDARAELFKLAGMAQSSYERFSRIAAWHGASDRFESAKGSMEAAASYMPRFPEDATLQCRNVRRALNDVIDRAPKFVRVYQLEFAALRTQSEDMDRDAQIAIEAKHRDAKRAWLAGEISFLSAAAGTYARIAKDGRSVETNRGAIVPIEHACRLARIARRVIAHGGKSWDDGAGPQVGHFRVTRIGADGSASIGCHEFDAAEGLRLLEVLESCAACAECVETV